jgi:hypothetical protein
VGRGRRGGFFGAIFKLIKYVYMFYFIFPYGIMKMEGIYSYIHSFMDDDVHHPRG